MEDTDTQLPHGEKRNRRRVRETVSTSEAVNASTGQSLGHFETGASRTVDERFCATCKDWIDTSKLGFLEASCGCPKCNTRW